MTRTGRAVLASIVALATVPFASASAASALPSHGYVVSLRPSSATGIRGPAMTLGTAEGTASARSVDRVVSRLGSQLGFRATHRYAHALTGFAAELTPAQVDALRRDPRVAGLSRSRTYSLAAEPAAQTVPTGISRVHARPPAVTAPVDADVAILDTGLSAARTDELDFEPGRGHNCVPRLDAQGRVIGPVDPADWADFHGHGTHVAGIVGARDNDIGVVGVAPGARIWAARVFGNINGRAAGRTEWITCAIDWVASLTEPIDPAEPEGPRKPVIEVVNMSLAGGGTDSPCSLDPGTPSSNPGHDAICRSVAAGTTYVVAAGNNARDVQLGATGHVLPAAYDEVITVSGLADSDGQPGGSGPACSGTDDGFGPYSNFGREVDLIAPGSCILSLGRGAGSTVTMTGTSMAAPAVAGAAAVHHATHPGLADDPAGAPAKVQRALRAAATLDWRWQTDPDGDPDRLLDVSRSLDGAPGIALWASPGERVLGSVGTQAAYAVDLSRASGFSDSVDLSISGLPSGVTASFADDPLSGLGGIETTLTLTVAPTADEGLHEVTVAADADALHAEAVATLMVDRQGPAVDGPHARFQAGGTLLARSAPLALSWSGSDALSGLERYVLRQRTDGGAWLSVPLSGPLAGGATRKVRFGKGHEYELRAFDRAGNGSTIVSPELTARSRESTGRGVALSPGWTLVSNGDASGDSLHRSRKAGARLTFDFTARSVAWVAPVGPGQGRARVLLDGIDQGRVDLTAATNAHRRIVYAARWDESRAHRLEIIVRGGTSPKPVGVDAFLVLAD